MAEDKFNTDFMNFIKSISGLKLSSLLILLIPLNAFSQTDTTDFLPEIDTSSNHLTGGSRHSLFTGIGFGSNMIYMGSTISGNQPFGYSALTYGYNNELFATASTVHLSGTDPYFAFYSGSLNYSHVFNSWFDISAGITGYKFSPAFADTLYSDFMYGDITLGVDWRLIYTKISVGGLISNENAAYFQMRNSRFIKTPKFINDKVYISFDPYVNMLFGTLIKAETTSGTMISDPTSIGRWSSGSQSTTNTSYTNTFGLLEIDFGLPVALNFDRITIEAETSYVLPAYNDPEFPGPKGFVFLLSGYFRIF